MYRCTLHLWTVPHLVVQEGVLIYAHALSGIVQCGVLRIWCTQGPMLEITSTAHPLIRLQRRSMCRFQCMRSAFAGVSFDFCMMDNSSHCLMPQWYEPTIMHVQCSHVTVCRANEAGEIARSDTVCSNCQQQLCTELCGMYDLVLQKSGLWIVPEILGWKICQQHYT